MHQATVGSHKILLTDGLLERDTDHIGMMVGHHLAETAFHDKLHGTHAELGGQHTVKSNRRTATLQVSQDGVTDVVLHTGGLQVFGQLFSGKAGLEVFSGPIGAAAVIGEYMNYGFTYILSIAASIAVSLGFFNLLPVPALDGSRALFALYELIFKKHIDRKTEGIIHTVGFIILMAFGLLIAFRDIINLRK